MSPVLEFFTSWFGRKVTANARHSAALSSLSSLASRQSSIQKHGFSMSTTASNRQNGSLVISDEVQEALHSKKGVVALESTIVTHGMPYPHNFSTAVSVERKIRESGSVPATIAVINGKIFVGLNDTELKMLAEKNSNLVKVSRRDLSYVMSQGLTGGTTVSGTMIAAHMAGISLFATGGIGGVHRGAETSFDISADLTELGRTPVAVVSSGVKSILDIGKTLEFLETQGVFVGVFGESRNFPAFFSRDSGHIAPYNVSSALKAAQLIHHHERARLTSGLLLAVPIPDQFALPGPEVEAVISQALDLAREQGITGKAVTPFILSQVNKMTAGSSLHANIALVENNAIVAGTVARCLSLLRQGFTDCQIEADPFVASMSQRTSCLEDSSSSPSTPLASSTSSFKPPASLKRNRTLGTRGEGTLGRPVVVGASVMDFLLQVKDDDFQMNGATYPGQMSRSFGGVGRNLADGLSRLGLEPAFLSVVGQDLHSSDLFAGCSHMDMNHVYKQDGVSTAVYCPVQNSSSQLLFGVGDMDVNSTFDLSKVPDFDRILSQASLVVLDANFTPEVIGQVVSECRRRHIPVWFEPTDVHKASKPFLSDAWSGLTFTSPNLAELKVMHTALRQKQVQDPCSPEKYVNTDNCESSELSNTINSLVSMCRDLTAYIPVLLVTLGQHGALLCHVCGDVTHLELGTPELQSRLLDEDPEKPRAHMSRDFRAWYYPALGPGMEDVAIASVSGAGDCLTAGFLTALHQDHPLDTCIKMGLLAASLSLQSKQAVPSSLSPQSVSTKSALTWGSMLRHDVTHGYEES